MTGSDGIALYNAAIEKYLHPDQEQKIMVRFKAIGRARILKQQTYKINSAERFSTIQTFLRKQLGLRESDTLV